MSVSVDPAGGQAVRREADDPGQNEENSRHQTLSRTQKSEYSHEIVAEIMQMFIRLV